MWLLLTLLIVVAVCVFYRYYLPFGGRSARGAWAASNNFRKGIFVNQVSTPMTMGLKGAVSLLREMRRERDTRAPKKPLQPEPINLQKFLASSTPEVIWLGHSTTLIRVDGKTILTDPILSQRASPFAFAGPKRLISRRPLTAEDLPPIDVVLISHDHYDHLDYKTISKLRGKTKKFLVPLGVAAHLRRWGVQASQIEELDWWASSTFENLRLTCTPARHFSGRTLTDRFKTLWCSWVVDAGIWKIFFSGDTGYGPHFKEIGDKYGPFDVTLMECGQYDKHWANIHMMPEQTVTAHQDLRGKRLFPIHWGAFVLALHPWAGSVRRAQKAAQAAHVQMIAAKIGEPVAVTSPQYPSTAWWDTAGS